LNVVSLGFALDAAFVSTSRAVGDLALCHVRLQDDARYAWLVLIPRLGGLSELEDLCEADRSRFMQEVVLSGKAVRAMGQALDRPVDKLNFGALGNVTAQLHGHVVGRRRGDDAWPGPVWGQGQAIPYLSPDLQTAMTVARSALSDAPGFSPAPN
jgi:diadenosine tetraphosphate (Ap4A) HIT family hydrolase